MEYLSGEKVELSQPSEFLLEIIAQVLMRVHPKMSLFFTFNIPLSVFMENMAMPNSQKS